MVQFYVEFNGLKVPWGSKEVHSDSDIELSKVIMDIISPPSSTEPIAVDIVDRFIYRIRFLNDNSYWNVYAVSNGVDGSF